MSNFCDWVLLSGRGGDDNLFRPEILVDSEETRWWLPIRRRARQRWRSASFFLAFNNHLSLFHLLFDLSITIIDLGRPPCHHVKRDWWQNSNHRLDN